jgi:hypothetical protein
MYSGYNGDCKWNTDRVTNRGNVYNLAGSLKKKKTHSTIPFIV